jgi:hypothetical protein
MITRETVLAAFKKRLADDPLVSAEWHAFARADLAATLAKSGRAPDDNRPLSTGGKCPESPDITALALPIPRGIDRFTFSGWRIKGAVCHDAKPSPNCRG